MRRLMSGSPSLAKDSAVRMAMSSRLAMDTECFRQYASSLSLIHISYIGGVLGQPAHPRIWSLILGVLTVAMIENRFSLISINANAQYIVTGVILILSMLFYKRKR